MEAKAGPNSHRAAQVLNLIQQLKAGELDKDSLFERLASLQQSPAQSHSSSQQTTPAQRASVSDARAQGSAAQQSPHSTPRDAAPVAHPSHANGALASAVSTPASNPSASTRTSAGPAAAALGLEDRKAIIQRIIAEKRRALEQNGLSNLSSDKPSAFSRDAAAGSSARGVFMAESEVDPVRDEDDHDLAEPPRNAARLAQSRSSGDIHYNGQGDYGGYRSDDGNRRISFGNSFRSNEDVSMRTRSSSDFRLHTRSSARHRRSMRDYQEAEYAECTFRPKTSPPPAYVRRERLEQPFFHRVFSWQDQQLMTREAMLAEKRLSETDGCTFKPAISQGARKLRRKVNEPATERLYAHGLDMLELKRRARERVAEEEVRRNCTFRPKTNGRSRSNPRDIAPRYLDTSTASSRRRAANASPNKDCTFAPKTNRVSRSMAAAQLYLQQNAFERLSRPRAASASPTRQGRASSAGSRTPRGSDLGDDLAGYATYRTPQAGGGWGRPSPAPLSARRLSAQEGENRTPRGSAASVTASVTPSAVAAAEEKLNQFLARQAAKAKERDTKLQRLAAEQKAMEEEPKQPRLSRGSKQILSQKDPGDFVLRNIDRALEQRKKKTAQVQAAAERECTHRPQITRAAKQRAGRSFEEMSAGDLARQQEAQERVRRQLETLEMDGVTFRPLLNASAAAAAAESRLKVVTDPENYLARIAQQQAERGRKGDSWKQQMERAEREECTFRPEVHDAPAYVRRIARSMQALRIAEQRPRTPEPARPDWR
eukprot:tig00021432_g21208.t1